MSYIKAEHQARVVVVVNEHDYKTGNHLHAIRDWLYFEFFGVMHFANTDHTPKLSKTLGKLFTEKLGRAQERVWGYNNGKATRAVVEVDEICMLTITKLPHDERIYTVSFEDFEGKPHMVHSESFVHRPHARCGLIYPEVLSLTEFGHQITFDRHKEPAVLIHPANHLHAIRMLVSTYEINQAKVAVLMDELTSSLSSVGMYKFEIPHRNVAVEVSLQNIERVVKTHLDSMGYWQEWLVEPKMERDFGQGKGPNAMRPCKVKFCVKFTATDGYALERYCQNTYGSIYELARWINNTIAVAEVS